MAIDEILRETVRGAVRAEIVGPSGWQPQCPLRKLNKRFLNNTIKSVMCHNKRTTNKKKLDNKNSIKKTTEKPSKFGPTKHKFNKPNKK